MIILITADNHTHTWRSFNLNRKTMLSRQLSIQDDILNRQIFNIIKEYKVGALLHGGDWFQSVGEVPVECLNIVNRFLQRIRAEGVVDESVTGNHDEVKRKDPQWYHNVINLFRDLPKTMQGYQRQIFEIGGIKVGFINYEDEVDYDKYVGLDIVIAHKVPEGLILGKHKFTDGVDWQRLADNNRLVFIAHIHQNQQLAENCYVIGSPMHFNFGDTGDRGVYIVDTDIWSVEFIKLEYPEFRTVDYPEQVIDDYNYYRVLQGDGSDAKANSVMVRKPKVFEERIKSDNIHNVVHEWVELNGKGDTYANLIIEDLSSIEQQHLTIPALKLASVVIKDFLSAGDIKYDVKGGFTLIGGQSEDTSSNGAGKTVIMDAIYWALFGKTTRGLVGDDVVRRGGPKDCRVELILDGGDEIITVIRSRKDGLQITRESYDDEVIAQLGEGFRQQDKQVFLEQLLGFNESLYMASCYFSQESLTMLTDMTDVDRTNMIVGLLGFGMYDKLYDIEAKKIKAKLDESAQQQVNKSQLENDIVVIKAKIEMLEGDMPSIEQSIALDKARIIDQEDKIKEVQSTPQTVSDIKVVDYDKQIATLQIKSAKLKVNAQGEAEKWSALKDKRSSLQSKMVGLASDIRSKKVAIEELNTQIDELNQSNKAKLGERCDKCGALVVAENAKLFEKEKLIKIKKLKAELESLSSDAFILNEEDKGLAQEVKSIEVEQERIALEMGDLQNKVEKANNDKWLQSEELNRTQKLKDQYTAVTKECENLIKVYKNNIRENERRLSKMTEDRDKYNDSILEIDDKIAAINETVRWLDEECKILEFWKVAFSPKGIKSLLLDKFCNDINSLVNECLSVISNGFMGVTVTPTSIIKSGEERNKLGIDISTGNAIVKYESLSGGEKKRVDFSLCVALNKYISNKFGLPGGILDIIIMDELFAYLDKSGEELIGQYLKDMSTNRAVFVITHTDELSLYADNYWTVIKENNVSRLEV